MRVIRSDLQPVQSEFAEADIRAMAVGRRQLKTEWPNALYPPEQSDKNWRIVLPFVNTYENAFRSMCKGVNHHLYHAKEDRLTIFLNDTEGDEEAPTEAVEWVEKVGHPVAMKDFLALSFALEYDREGGDPKKTQTEIGVLRGLAKPYGGTVPSAETRKAADSLAEHCLNFLNTMSCYSSADCIVAMPPSDPSKSFNLPRHLAGGIAEEWGRENLSEHVVGKPRNSIKDLPLAQKLDTLLETIEVAAGVFTDKHVLLLDDLYQSGISMNYCGLLLLQAGAKKIFGLACEKTCRNDDNVGEKI